MYITAVVYLVVLLTMSTERHQAAILLSAVAVLPLLPQVYVTGTLQDVHAGCLVIAATVLVGGLLAEYQLRKQRWPVLLKAALLIAVLVSSVTRLSKLHAATVVLLFVCLMGLQAAALYTCFTAHRVAASVLMLLSWLLLCARALLGAPRIECAAYAAGVLLAERADAAVICNAHTLRSVPVRTSHVFTAFPTRVTMRTAHGFVAP